MKIDQMINIAQVSRKNGKSTEEEQHEVLRAAQAANITYFNYIRTRLFLDVADDNTQTVKVWLSDVEYGDYNDNCHAFNIYQRCIRAGDAKEGIEGMLQLGKHIKHRGDQRSIEQILPRIEAIAGVV
jgi:hypothetical protein